MKSLVRVVVVVVLLQLLFGGVRSQSSLSLPLGLPQQCSMTFDSSPSNVDSTFPNANLFICPSSCFTRRYLTSHAEYPVFGNESYSGNSLICKSAWHDGRLSPSLLSNVSLYIRNSSTLSSVFPSALRNGILSSKSSSVSYLVYQFVNNRLNETSIPDIAIEHRQYLYSPNDSSSIICQSKVEINPLEPLPIDQGWKTWSESPLRYFSFPHNYSRNASLDFCQKNNGTLIFWANNAEETLLRNVLLVTLFGLFRGQRVSQGNNSLSFFIGWKQINGVQQWESNLIPFNQSLISNWNSLSNSNDYCTILRFDASLSTSIQLVDHRCDDPQINAYPLCRRQLPSSLDAELEFIYRLDTDDADRDLSGVIDFCGQAGGYPIYANNAYEWQLIQEIMFKDPNFNFPYVYTGLRSLSKQVTDAYWTPRNVSYNSSLDYLFFTVPRSSTGTSYHLSKANDESYYYLYDLDPSTPFFRLRFCRKDDIRGLSSVSSSCNSGSCQSSCQSLSLPSASGDVRFGFYQCRPKTSLAGIVVTHSFPRSGDFILDNLPVQNGVSLRQPFNETLIFNVTQSDPNLRLRCFEHLNLDRDGTLGDTSELFCDAGLKVNKIISSITLRQNFNGLLSITFEDRPLTGHHLRFIDYPQVDSRCRFQGVYHPFINQCICAPGFYGSECQFTCPPGYYGQTCSFHCSGNNADYCRSLLICLPDPYGCSCYSGWYGIQCNQSCPVGVYGPGCVYPCPCDNCNRFTGLCDCNGTECYQGVYNRFDLESKCSSSSSSSNLALIIVLPIVGTTIVLLAIGLLVYWKVVRGREGRNSFVKSSDELSPTSTSF